MSAEALVEVGSPTRQTPLESKRRWFHSREMDLFVWLDDSDQPFKFELCYPERTREFSLRWEAELGFEHSAVDSGKGAGSHTAAQLLAAADGPDIAHIKGLFLEAAAGVPDPIRRLVHDALTHYPNNPSAPGRRPTPAQVRSRWPLHMSGDGLMWVIALIVTLWLLHAVL